VSSVIIWFISLSILAGQLLGASSILEVVAGLPRWAGALAAAVVVVVYFVAGGLLTSAWVNLVQLAVKLVGFPFRRPDRAGAGRRAGQRCLRRGACRTDISRSAGADGSPLWFIALLAPAFIVSPGLVQKGYGARSAEAVRVGVGANASRSSRSRSCP
jgi:SSS family solute:Na+ symporter